jgi:Ser/Thr protein kinase RdoA (MazF antagonist)
MIPVPGPVLESLAKLIGTEFAYLQHFGGGQESSDGIVYAYPHKGNRRLLKIMAIPVDDRRRGLLSLQERLRFVRFLGENGAPIVFPKRTPQGSLYETIDYDGNLWIGYSMDIAPGRTKREKTWDPQFFRSWGQAIGMLHRLAQEYPSWQAAVDPESGEKFLTWQAEWQGFYDWCQDDEVKSQWLQIKRQLEALPVARDSFGFIHNDPHIWNLLADSNRVTILDFDVANHHWFINDIAIACQNNLAFLSGGMGGPVRNRKKLLDFLSFFMQGYARENQLSPEWLDQLDLFIAYRRILMFTVMNDWIRSQPGLHKSWKQMILTQPEIVGSFSAH